MTSALAASPAVHAIGIALIWFVLQGAIAGAVVAALLMVARHASADLRYLLAGAGLVAMVVMPVATAARHWTPARAISAQPSHATPRESVDGRAGARASSEGTSRARVTPDSVAPIAVLVWMTGVLALTARLLGGWLQVVRIRRSAVEPEHVEWAETVARIARDLGIHRVVRTLESALVGVPVVIGWLRPVILLPAGVFAGLAPDQVEAILAHELAHIRRGDYVVNALQRVAEIVLFYHPAVWWVSARIRQEREHCCDDLAAPLASSRLTYARALVALEERRGSAPSLAMAATRSSLFARIRRIVDPSSTIDSTLSKGTVMTIVSSVVALALTGAMSVGHAAPAPAALTPAVAAAAQSRQARPQPSVTVVEHPESATIAESAARTTQASGSIHGIVSDQHNGRIPGATVTVNPIGREGAVRTTVSDQTGQFAVSGLADGDYLLTVKLSGFKVEERSIQLVQGTDRTANVQLMLGSKDETIAVLGSGPEASNTQQGVSTAAVPGLLDAAKAANDAGRFAEAEASLRQALAIVHAALPRPRTDSTTRALLVGGDIREPKKIRDVPPIYPAVARAAGIQGVVVIDATIDPYGDVADAQVIRGVPELNEAALDAVRQWGYTPTLLSGEPVSIRMSVTVIFTIK